MNVIKLMAMVKSRGRHWAKIIYELSYDRKMSAHNYFIFQDTCHVHFSLNLAIPTLEKSRSVNFCKIP